MTGLFLEFCDYRTVPAGGQLTFAINFVHAFGRRFDYVGLLDIDHHTSGAHGDMSSNRRIGTWTDDLPTTGARLFGVAESRRFDSRRLLPNRVAAIVACLRYVGRLRKVQYERVFVQSPEALFCALFFRSRRIEYRFAGADNAVRFSRHVWARPFASIFWWVFCKALRRVDRVYVTAGDGERRLLENDLRRRGVRAPMTFLPTLVDQSTFQFCPNFPTDRPRFVFCGRLNAGKRVDQIIRAFALVVRDLPKATLALVGDGEERRELEALAEALSVKGRVKFLGSRPPLEVAAALASSNVFVLASEREGWPTALVEAVCVGRFAVSTTVSGAKEIIDSPVRGVVVESNKEEVLRDAMLHAWAIVSSGAWSPSRDDRFHVGSLPRMLCY